MITNTVAGVIPPEHALPLIRNRAQRLWAALTRDPVEYSSTEQIRAVVGLVEDLVVVVEQLAARSTPPPRAVVWCACGKPVGHLTADPDSSEWACRVPAAPTSGTGS